MRPAAAEPDAAAGPVPRRFDVEETGIAGLRIVTRKPIADRRGFLARHFCADELLRWGWTKPIAQINETLTAKAGTLRGLHLQHAPQAEMKLVICLRGSIFDVAVDLRGGSPTLLAHRHAILSADNHRAALIPEGCAHGFQALTDDVQLLYLHSAPYDPACEDGVAPFDPRLAIAWPLPGAILSDRDAGHPRLPSDFRGWTF